MNHPFRRFLAASVDAIHMKAAAVQVADLTAEPQTLDRLRHQPSTQLFLAVSIEGIQRSPPLFFPIRSVQRQGVVNFQKTKKRA